MKFKINIISFLVFGILYSMEYKDNSSNNHLLDNNYSTTFGKVGEYGTLPNPMNDRAKGFLLKGKVQSAITNYGNFINWDFHPAALWGEYTYLPTTAFQAGVPGHAYTYKYEWYNNETNGDCPSANGNFVIWCSEEAYQDPSGIYPGFSWYENNEVVFVSVVFETQNDDGIIGEQLLSPWELDVQTCNYQNSDNWLNHWSNGICQDNPSFDEEECCVESLGTWEYIDGQECDFNGINQWCLDEELYQDGNQRLMISLPVGDEYIVDPNNANVYGDRLNKRGAGLVYPWALRPALDKRLGIDTFDLYKYGNDQEEWTEDDVYDYFGFNVAESHFTRWSPSSNAEWQATSRARENTHNTLFNDGDLFGNINYLSTGTYPLLAHSEEQGTWPVVFDENAGDFVTKWPGWWAENYNPISTGCFPAYRWNDDCWEVVDGRFISDMDVYMEFDDRWAHRGSMVSNNEYEQAGYPMGLKVMAEAHSYGVSFAEDIMFVTVKVRNESGDNWRAFERDRYGQPVDVLDSDGNPITGDAMIMPDGTKLNQGEGFNYKNVHMGFNMDADVVSANKFGNFGVHTNDDDFMEYYDCKNPDLDPDGCDIINDDTLRVSIAMIYDYDYYNDMIDVGIVATQLLDSPYASEEVDLNGDGYADLYPGDKLKMTDWHWYDWYNRPGVVYREGDAGCCAGDPGASQAQNKEEIMYKILSGDTTNLSTDEREWYFHTNAPAADDHENNLNPHFDSLDGLELTDLFNQGPEGLDCVLEMSCGPFSLEVGEQVPFSFCIIFGENKNDLIKNATFAQLMYNSHYQGYTAPDVPTITATTGEKNPTSIGGQHHYIRLSWDTAAESSSDVVTGYYDFEGYKLYKSMDGGTTWGDPDTDKLYDENGALGGWKPYAQFHLTAEEDSLHCTFSNDYHGRCTKSVPEFYVYSDCFDTYPEPLNNSGDGIGCFDDSWQNNIRTNCDRITVEAYSGLPVFSTDDLDDKTDFLPFYSYEVDCDNIQWGGDSNGIPDIRGMNVCGEDTHVPWMGLDALGKCHNETGLKYTFLDSNVIDGLEYTYAITSYDMGIAPDITYVYNDDTGILEEIESTANPLHFASPDGYQSIETSTGRTIKDKNYITVSSGSAPSRGLRKDIGVVPNPFIVSSAFNNTEYMNRVRFIHLPEKCKINIFTISGEKVIALHHYEHDGVDETKDDDTPDDTDNGNHWWNLRTSNNQVVAPGLYIYVVENLTEGHKGEQFIGKFAVVR